MDDRKASFYPGEAVTLNHTVTDLYEVRLVGLGQRGIEGKGGRGEEDRVWEGGGWGGGIRVCKRSRWRAVSKTINTITH